MPEKILLPIHAVALAVGGRMLGSILGDESFHVAVGKPAMLVLCIDEALLARALLALHAHRFEQLTDGEILVRGRSVPRGIGLEFLGISVKGW